jgi:hypothetical protein
MIESREDTLEQNDLSYIMHLIERDLWSDELLKMYEKTYREVKRVAIKFGLDTTELDNSRNLIMERHGQL